MTEPTSSRLNAEPSADVVLPTRRELRAREAAGIRSGAVSGTGEPLSTTAPIPIIAPAEQVVEPSAVVLASAAPAAIEPADTSVAESFRTSAAPAIPRADAATTRSAGMKLRRAAAASAPLRTALTAPPATPKKSRRGLARSFVTFAVVPGLFLTAALPAYAFMPGGDQRGTSEAREAAEAGAQSVDITSFSPEISVAADGFAAVSGEEIQRLTLEAERLANEAAAAEAESSRVRSGANATPGVRQEGDDYPWAFELTDDQGGGLSPLNYYYRECVDFVAWRLNRDAGATGPFKWVWSNLTPGGGSAYNWANEWNKHGWTTSYEPITGAVAWFTGNHVAYVQSVPGDGTVVLEEYNWGNDHSYHRRTVAISEVPLFLYPPP